STVDGNYAAGDGGGIAAGGDTTIDSSTISNNTAESSGGGIYRTGGSVSITNSTLSGNAAGEAGGGPKSLASHTRSIVNSTFTGNRADRNGTDSGTGGAINSGDLTTVSNSIFVGNFKGTGSTSDDLLTHGDTITNGFNNIFGVLAGTDILNGASNLL